MGLTKLFRGLGEATVLVAYGLAVLSLLIQVRQILVLFQVITLGSVFLPVGRHMVFFGATELPGYLEMLWLIIPLLVPGLVVFSIRACRAGRHRLVAVVIPCLTAIAVVALSYRFLALLALVLLSILQVRFLRHASSPRPSLCALALVVTVCLVPVDFSFQRSTAEPHFAPSASGCLTGYTYEAARRGKVVIVGGCGWFYNEPRLVWLW